MHNKPVCVEKQPNKGTMRNANKQNPEFRRVQQKDTSHKNRDKMIF